MKRLSLNLALLPLALSACAGEAAPSGASSSDVVSAAEFSTVACADSAPVKKNLGDFSPSALAAAGLSCATLTVPEDRAAPGSRRIELSIVVAKASSGSHGAPLVMITGGPSTPSLNLLQTLVPGAPFSALRRDRDVILVGERGEEFASARLDCPELDALVDGVVGADGLVHPITAADRIPKLSECYRRHAGNADLSAYDVPAMAADVHDAVRALGHDKYALYGVSFGTGLSQSIAKMYPSEIEAVILDSPVTFWDAKDAAHSLTGNVHVDAARSMTDAWRTLFASCRADAACDARHPDLEGTFRAMLADLDSHPLELVVRGSAKWKVGGAQVFGLLANQFNPTMIPLMPRVIEGIKARDPGILAQLEPMLVKTLDPGPDAASGLTLSVDCSGWSFVNAEFPTADVDPLVQRYSFPFMAEELDECARAWPVPRVRDRWPGFTEPLVSATLPVLILPGKFDANTHPFKAEQIHAHLQRSFVHVVPDRGHVTISECPISMMNAFLGDAAHGDPDATCLGAMTTNWQ